VPNALLIVYALVFEGCVNHVHWTGGSRHSSLKFARSARSKELICTPNILIAMFDRYTIARISPRSTALSDLEGVALVDREKLVSPRVDLSMLL